MPSSRPERAPYPSTSDAWFVRTNRSTIPMPRLARDLRLLVRERLVAGDSNAEVVDYLVDRYGEFVLLQPRFGLHTLDPVAWPFRPPGARRIGCAQVAPPGRRTGNSGEAALSPDEARRLDDLMKRGG
jgi:cytochrome c-type biogenesis protein CcmH